MKQNACYEKSTNTPARLFGRCPGADEARIREAYTNGPQHEVQIIPAKHDTEPEGLGHKLRVCAYCRVSTDEDMQERERPYLR